MVGQNNNIISTVGSADDFASPSFSIPEVPVTPRRTSGHYYGDSATTPQLSSPDRLTYYSCSPDPQVTPTARHSTGVYETCTPLDYTGLSAADFFTPIPLSFSAFSRSVVPSTPLGSRGVDTGTILAHSDDLDIDEDWGAVSRTLFGSPSPGLQEVPFPSSPVSSSTEIERASLSEDDDPSSDSDNDDNVTVGYTATGTPIPLHRCSHHCEQNPWFCPRAPEPELNGQPLVDLIRRKKYPIGCHVHL